MKSVGDYQIEDEAKNLLNLMPRVLAAVEAVYDRLGIPMPARRYWAFGRPAEDCEQLVVSFIQSYLGSPGDQASEPQHCDAPRTAVLNISVTRPTAIGKGNNPIPTPAAIQEAAAWTALDAWALIDSTDEFDTWSDYGRGPGVIATVNVNDPAGGFQTTLMNLTVVIP